MIKVYIPSFLDESLSVFLQFFLLKANNDTKQLVLQSLKSDSVVDDHSTAKHSRSVLGVGQLSVQIQPEETRVISLPTFCIHTCSIYTHHT